MVFSREFSVQLPDQKGQLREHKVDDQEIEYAGRIRLPEGQSREVPGGWLWECRFAFGWHSCNQWPGDFGEPGYGRQEPRKGLTLVASPRQGHALIKIVQSSIL